MDNYRTIERKLATLTPFNGNSLRATWELGADGGEYVVYSYQTEIARFLPSFGGEYWVSPDKYSVTTSRQQNLIKRAWGLV
jgi:hypothetical protein